MNVARSIAAAGFVLLTLLAGCEPASSQPARPRADGARNAQSLTDYVVNPIVQPSEAGARKLRIVSTAPRITEICCALGLSDQLVGRTKYCVHPPGIEHVPSIGALAAMNAELLLSLKADLILVSGSARETIERLERLGLPYESLPDVRLADLFESIERVGARTGRPRSARKLNEAIRADLSAVEARFAETPAARVLLLTGTLSDPPAPPFVAGPGAFYDELLRRAGHANVVGPDGWAFGQLSLEIVLRSDPDVIVELDPDGKARPHGEADALAVWSKIGPLKAVTNKRVRVLTGPQHYLLGPRIAHTFQALSRAVAGAGDE